MKTTRARRWLTVLIASVAATSLVLGTQPNVQGHAPPMSAMAAPGEWTPISDDALGLNQIAGVTRWGDDLHVSWSQHDPGSVRSVRTRTLDADGEPVGDVAEVVTGWLALTIDPKILVHDGELMTVFSGIRSTGTPEPYVGYAFFATSPDGQDWTLEPGRLSQTQSAGNASVTDAVNGAGEPLWGMGGFGGRVIMHRGTMPPSPADTPDFFTDDNGCCPTLDVTFANDRGSGDVYVGWTNLSGDTAETAGVFVQRIWPQPGGPVHQAPGSANGGQSVGAGMPGFVAERVGGGVWAAYRLGYPTSSTIRLWEVGTANTWDVTSPSGTVDSVTLTAAPEGRLWLSWRGVGDGLLYAARTDRDVTRLGKVRKVVPPGGDGFIWSVATDGESGPLDVIANIQAFDDGPRLYATQVLPALTAKARPKKLNKGKVTVVVSDAGDAVSGATVRLRRRSVTTNAAGEAVFTIGRKVKSKTYRATVTKNGYEPAITKVKVT